MIDSKKLAYGHGGGDEAYTPDYGVTPILEIHPTKCKGLVPI